MRCHNCNRLIPLKRVKETGSGLCVVCQKQAEDANRIKLMKKRASGQLVIEVPSLTTMHQLIGIQVL